MNELQQRIQSASRHVRMDWSEARERRVEQRVHTSLRRQGIGRAAAGVVMAAATIALAVGLGKVQTVHEARTSLSAIRLPDLHVVLEDGSGVYAETGEIELRTLEARAERVTLRLEQGSARFEVVPNASRIFEVLAGEVTVRVLGTGFVVTKTPVGARVSVAKGRVRVSWAGQSVELGSGEGGDFPTELVPRDETEEAPAEPSLPRRKTSALRVPPPVIPSQEPDWQSLARDGNYDRAYHLWKASGNADTSEELMLAADVARLSRHPSEAVAPLREVTQRHAGDPRAPLAAFTLGRLLLDQLGSPREAASAFDHARRLSPGGALAEDALAREVECWSRAGDSSQARRTAELYVRSYPNGRRINAVRKFGGLE